MKPNLFPESKGSPPSLVETVVSTHPFFEGMSPHHLRLLADGAMPAHFTANELVFREGDPANRFYLVQKGSVALESVVKHKGRVPIQVIGAGEVLGWSWLFPPYFWHFDARALGPVDAVFIYGTPIREECESDHEFGYELMKRLSVVMLKRLQATRCRLLGTAQEL